MFYFTRLTTLCFALFLAANQIQAATFYVSTSGDDSWSGQLEAANEGATDGPFRSLERSVAAVKKVQREAGTQVKTVVRIRGGRY
ncbi:MAG: right-handed parallel beta-helix repeat-containing protein, partial [Candidatus Omnitrophica bacterium]|nr:right-handed parallel beta-helix repeat-containing protein [Candidatus Omnitrophota bacterium]